MIPRIGSAGRSFKGLAQYLCHDPNAESAERVAWIMTLNCAHNDAPSAVNEMYMTYLDAELLKEEAGIRGGGRQLEKPVKHFSLNWHPSEEPTREQMIAATESFLKHMGWEEHQALLVAHDDKEHQHLHVMLNAVHPETGVKLDDGLERRRAQEWALAYEREHGKVFCEERLKDPADREQSPPREAWEKLKEAELENERAEAARRQYDPDYLKREDARRTIETEEWKILKEFQRKEREAFFADGKQAFNELRKDIYREVREEFREEWATYYAARRDGLDADLLREIKAGLLERQSAMLDERRDEACGALREARDAQYAEILASQRDVRADLGARQERGLSSPHLLDLVNQEPEFRNADYQRHGAGDADLAAEFRSAASEICQPVDERIDTAQGWFNEWETGWNEPRGDDGGVRSGADMAGDLGGGLIGAISAIGERLFDGFLGGGETVRPAPPPTSAKPEKPRDNPFARVAEAAVKNAEQQEIEARRNNAYWEERERERGWD